jgi:hypothetical protein
MVHRLTFLTIPVSLIDDSFLKFGRRRWSGLVVADNGVLEIRNKYFQLLPANVDCATFCGLILLFQKPLKVSQNPIPERFFFFICLYNLLYQF